MGPGGGSRYRPPGAAWGGQGRVQAGRQAPEHMPSSGSMAGLLLEFPGSGWIGQFKQTEQDFGKFPMGPSKAHVGGRPRGEGCPTSSLHLLTTQRAAVRGLH